MDQILSEERYIASRAYTANEPDEMGFQKGVVVDVLEKNIDGWWLIRSFYISNALSLGLFILKLVYLLGCLSWDDWIRLIS